MGLDVEVQYPCDLDNFEPAVIWQHHLPPLQTVEIAIPAYWTCCSCQSSQKYELPHWLRRQLARHPSTVDSSLPQDLQCEAKHGICRDCVLVDESGATAIRTVEGFHMLPYAEAPAFWLCDGGEGGHFHLNELKLVKAEKSRRGGDCSGIEGPSLGTECSQMKCNGRLGADSWLASPYNQYLGTYDRREIARCGPWHAHYAFHWPVETDEDRAQREEKGEERQIERPERCDERLARRTYPAGYGWARERTALVKKYKMRNKDLKELIL